MSDVRKMAEEMREELSSIRRDFHSHPELSGQEYRTADKICEYLDGWGIEYRRGLWPWCGASAQERRWESGRIWTPCP